MSYLHTGALNDKNLAIYPGDVFVGDNASTMIDLGAVNNVQFSTDNTTTKIDSDNREKLITKIKPSGKLAFDWLEPNNLRALSTLFKGVVDLIVSDGVAPITATTEKTTLDKVTAYQLKYQNADGTAVTPTVTTTAGATLVAGTDYTVATVAGYTTVILATGYATATESVSIDYAYIPNEALTIKPSASGVAKNRYIEVTAPIVEGAATKYRKVRAYSATATSALLAIFSNVDRTNDVGTMPVELDFGTDWEIVDEYNV